MVAVHGVADQRPGDSARQIADLIRLAAPEAYSTFRETRLRIPAPEILAIELPPRCAGLELRPEVEHSAQAGYDQRLREQGPRFAELALGHRSASQRTTSRERVYDTLRLEAMRSALASKRPGRTTAYRSPHPRALLGRPFADWAAGLAASPSELWSLLIHVLWLGREALRTAREVERPERGGWAFRVLDSAHRLAHRTFTLALLPFNLMLAILLALLLATAVPALPASWLFAAMAAGAGAVLGGEALRRPRRGALAAGFGGGSLGRRGPRLHTGCARLSGTRTTPLSLRGGGGLWWPPAIHGHGLRQAAPWWPARSPPRGGAAGPLLGGARGGRRQRNRWDRRARVSPATRPGGCSGPPSRSSGDWVCPGSCSVRRP